MQLLPSSKIKKGSVLVFSLIILAFMLVSALSVAVISVTEKRASLATDKSNRSFQVADTGVETILQKIYKASPQPADLTALAILAGATCTTDKIQASVGSGTYVVSFLDSANVNIPCGDTSWRSRVVKIKSEGTAGNTKRAVEVGIQSPEVCLVPSVDYDGDTYDTVTIGDQCWMKQNMNVGTRISTSTAQAENSTIEKYCYSDDSSNCTSPHPTHPDGGLYQWDEAMQYTTSSGAQGICPSGWHIPTDSEWYTLENFLSAGSCDATRLGMGCAPAGTTLQLGDFSGNLAGYVYSGLSSGRDGGGRWWSSSETGVNAFIRYLVSANPEIMRATATKSAALSVRCLQDN